MQRTHGVTHYDPENCFGCRVRTVSISADGTPTVLPRVASSNEQERQWSKDHDAFRRLSREGLAPHSLDGAAKIEATAKTRSEVENIQIKVDGT